MAGTADKQPQEREPVFPQTEFPRRHRHGHRRSGHEGDIGVVDERLEKAAHWLAGQANGIAFGCVVSESLGNWRGPGRKDDPCPYATLVMLKLLLRYGDAFSGEISACSECLLDLWASSRTKHPYIFYMGNDFRRLKLPDIWYDILHVVDVLSQVKVARTDPRFIAMVDVIRAKEKPEGFVPESICKPWKGWNLGQKNRRTPRRPQINRSHGSQGG